MLELLTNPDAWIALATLTLLEIVLGIDNIVFIAILASRLPVEKQALAYRLGLLGAMVTRVALLMTINWVMQLTDPLFEILGRSFSGRDLILLGGGLFLIAKEYTGNLRQGRRRAGGGHPRLVQRGLPGVVAQIMVLDIIFSLDSVITAVGMAEHIEVMVTADRHRDRRHVAVRKADRRLRQRVPLDEDPSPILPPADRRFADGGGPRPAHQQGLHLLRDGVCPDGRAAQHSLSGKARGRCRSRFLLRLLAACARIGRDAIGASDRTGPPRRNRDRSRGRS